MRNDSMLKAYFLVIHCCHATKTSNHHSIYQWEEWLAAYARKLKKKKGRSSDVVTDMQQDLRRKR
jgi:hypothetical protein